MIKKMVAILMAMILMSISICGFADEGTVFSTFFMDIIDKQSASEWYSSSAERATLTLLLYMDFLLETDKEMKSDLLTKPSYVAKDGTTLMAIVPHGDDYIIIGITPSSPSSAVYSIQKDTTSLVVELGLEATEVKYEENNKKIMAEVIDLLAKALGD